MLPLSACGEGEAQFAAVDVKRAEWREERVLVAGDWAKGILTPPTCRVLEGRNGPVSDYFGPDARVSLDGNTFSKEFVPVKTSRQGLPAKKGDHYVSCAVSLDSGRSANDSVKIEGTS